MKRRDFFISAIAATAIATTGRLLRAEPKKRFKYKVAVVVPSPFLLNTQIEQEILLTMNSVFEGEGEAQPVSENFKFESTGIHQSGKYVFGVLRSTAPITSAILRPSKFLDNDGKQKWGVVLLPYPDYAKSHNYYKGQGAWYDPFPFMEEVEAKFNH